MGKEIGKGREDALISEITLINKALLNLNKIMEGSPNFFLNTANQSFDNNEPTSSQMISPITRRNTVSISRTKNYDEPPTVGKD